MKNNLEKYTKAELISKLNEKQEKIEARNKKIEANQENKKEKSVTIWDIISKIKIFILSLSVITILNRFFKNYKSIRAILKVANYIIVTMFGYSLFEAFGLGFIHKIFGELKYILTSIYKYLTDSTFYNYLYNLYHVAEEKEESIRTVYKKPVEVDWKAELEKAERKREWDKWLERHKHLKEDEGIDKTKSALLVLLVLGASLGIWYYGKDALDVISPIWNVGNLIKRILRGNMDDDDNTPPTPADIGLDPNSGAVSPAMLVYSSDAVDKEKMSVKFDNLNPPKAQPISDTPIPPAPSAPIPPSPPAPPIPPAPPAPPIPPTEHGAPEGIIPKTTEVPEEVKENKPTSLLDSLKLGKKLKSVKITEASSSKVTLEDTKENEGWNLKKALSNRLSKMSDVMDEETDNSEWEESEKTTPTNKGKNKFLEAISRDESTPKTVNTNTKVSKSLDAIRENFPGLSQETLEKLSTVEGIKNREEIINSLPDSELAPNITKKINDYSEKEQEKIIEIINSSKKLDSTELIASIKNEFPDYDESSYRQSFINATKEEISSGKTELERKSISSDILNADLSEIEKIKDRTDLKTLKNAINENYTVSSIMNEIKSKSSLTKLIEKAKKVENLSDLEDITLLKLESEASKTKPDILIPELLELPTKGDNSYINDLIDRSVRYNIDKIVEENPGIRKNQAVEMLLAENPEHKDKIAYFMKETYSQNFERLSEKLTSKQNEKLLKILRKEDLKDRESLSENRSIDQIKAMTIINSTHNSLLDGIKHKASLRSIKSKENNSLSSTEQLENTMDLFD